ncbi:MAG: nickel pincer cofactor biosynthesis protein LarB [Actinomycetota bacterium]|nr:nickel pincer cofactor biosynthesis protein LarB [Actinomycetota bacterium]
MNESSIRRLLRSMKDGQITEQEAVEALRAMPFSDLGFAKLDHHREIRSGLPESVFGVGKTPEQVAKIVENLKQHSSGPVLVTKASQEQFDAVIVRLPEARYFEAARMIVVGAGDEAPVGTVAIAVAGTSDLPVAEECHVTLSALGVKVERLDDVGVAGLHRLLSSIDVIQSADVVIAIAGMEGALASIVGGLVSAPVIAVPTSVGYGSGADGLAALLSMLNSCAPGIGVVNIDNGYGAAILAFCILNKRT